MAASSEPVRIMLRCVSCHDINIVEHSLQAVKCCAGSHQQQGSQILAAWSQQSKAGRMSA